MRAETHPVLDETEPPAEVARLWIRLRSKQGEERDHKASPCARSTTLEQNEFAEIWVAVSAVKLPR